MIAYNEDHRGIPHGSSLYGTSISTASNYPVNGKLIAGTQPLIHGEVNPPQRIPIGSRMNLHEFFTDNQSAKVKFPQPAFDVSDRSVFLFSIVKGCVWIVRAQLNDFC